MNNPTTTIIFDFDGTVALGDGPVLAYAQQVARELGDPAGFLAGVRASLAAGDAGSLDGYDVVRRAAEAAGADPVQLGRAYFASRGQLATEHAPITAPAGLAGFLADAGAAADRILVTNAPDIRLIEALSALGLNGLFDRIVTDAGKPAGLDAVLDDLPAGSRALSIGDIWHNDLAPAQRRGHATALVGDFIDPAAAPTFRADSLTALLPQLREWLAGADVLTTSPSVSTAHSTAISHTTEG